MVKAKTKSARYYRGLRDNSPLIALIVSVAVLFCVLQFYRLPESAASRDEAFSWRLIQYPLTEQVKRTSQDVHPPLYYILLTAWAAVAGNSIVALRSFSIIAVLAAIVVTVAAVRETLHHFGDRVASGAARSGAVFTFIFLAIHVTEQEAGRNARMYGLGMLCASLSAWALAKVMFSRPSKVRWWIVYGIAISAFAYTHYYALFTILAQGIFVVGATLLKAIRSRDGQWHQDAMKILLALGIAGVSYSPWVPVLFRQISDVQEGFWIPMPTWSDVGRTMFTWGTGYRSSSTLDWCTLSIGCSLLFAVPILRISSAASFWLLQAFIPWICAAYISRGGGMAILWTHYFSFAHIALGALAGVTIASIPHRTARLGAGSFFLAASIYGSWDHVASRFSESPPIARALQFISERYQEGDLILAPWFGEVNKIRYYAGRSGLRDVDIHALRSEPGAAGHKIHIASLQNDELLDLDNLLRVRDLRIWQIGLGIDGGVPELSTHVITRRFTRQGDINDCTVSLHAKVNGEWLKGVQLAASKNVK